MGWATTRVVVNSSLAIIILNAIPVGREPAHLPGRPRATRRFARDPAAPGSGIRISGAGKAPGRMEGAHAGSSRMSAVVSRPLAPSPPPPLPSPRARRPSRSRGSDDERRHRVDRAAPRYRRREQGGRARVGGVHPALLDPSKATEKAPDVFQAKFTTTKGDFVIEVHRELSPNGADRFYSLVKMGFFDDTRFFRAVDGFMVQFGISGDPLVASKWQSANIPDDPVKGSNKRGFVTFAQRNTPNTRGTQVFVNYGDNSRLDGHFAPFGAGDRQTAWTSSIRCTRGYGEGAR